MNLSMYFRWFSNERSNLSGRRIGLNTATFVLSTIATSASHATQMDDASHIFFSSIGKQSISWLPGEKYSPFS
jgi:hypothetical protein